MKPAPFDYVADQPGRGCRGAGCRERRGQDHGRWAKPLPLLNFRVTRPSVVVDLRKILGLSFIEDRGSTIAIGA